MKPSLLILVIALIILISCSGRKRFVRVPSSHSGITFANTITETDSVNVLNFEYIYNGAGVGVGDFNNDGLQDIYFSGNQVPSKLYLNKGNFRFEDITQKAGIATPYWGTGVSLIDINQDGLLDIYLSTISPYKKQSAPNLLFVNQGIGQDGAPTFKEQALQVGLADRGYSTQAAFFDYDLDGDLDAYILTNALEYFDRSLPRPKAYDGSGRSTDRLYRNEGVQPNGLPHFTNVSKEAGITIEGWGLGIGVSDFNNDGWPDIYCANDFISNDLLWINNQNGTFTNRIGEYMKHQSHNSMGMDIADINNDGWCELITLDMMPDDNMRQKMMFGKPSTDRYELNLSRGYQPQFVRNMLQLNNGADVQGHVSFSEIGQLAGIYATDWSWSPLFADFDNDGYKDLLVTNGYVKDVTSLDFVTYNPQSAFSFTRESDSSRQQRLKKMQELIGVKKTNFLFHNQHDLTFEDVTEAWGLKIPSYSNGAVYTDLDNDGDLDIVINNLNDEAFVYENTLHTQSYTGHYIRIKLEGTLGNKSGLGAKVELFAGGNKQYIENSPYKSSVEPWLHFGLGKTTLIDSVIVHWPNGGISKVSQVAANSTLVVPQSTATFRQPLKNKTQPLYQPLPMQPIVQAENYFIDYKNQVLLLHMLSRQGPAMAAGDVDGNGLDDIVIGAATGLPETILCQKASGKFTTSQFSYPTYKKEEDAGLLLFDIDQDADLDMLIASGGNEYRDGSPNYRPRFFRNDGRGNFKPDTVSIPPISIDASCALAADYDRDGDLDVFLGGRTVPGQYPLPPRSYLLQNTNGKLADITDAVAKPLATIGMITSGLWTDFDNDGWIDLVLAGEFMPLTFLRNINGKLTDITLTTMLPNTTGWWNSLVGGDFDNDGDTDYLAGNFGLNSRFKASADEPVTVYAKDFDRNGAIDPFLTYFVQGKEYPIYPRDQLVEQVPALKKRVNSYAAYGAKSFDQVIHADEYKDARVLKAVEFKSSYIENKGNGKFSISPLPMVAQTAPIHGMVTKDFNEDGNLDVLLAGNLYATDVQIGRYDASKGLVLKGDGKGNFQPMPMQQTGLMLDKDAKSVVNIHNDDGTSFLFVGNNSDTLQVYAATRPLKSKRVKMDDAFAILEYANGKKQKIEFYYGSGYLSQAPRYLHIPKGASNCSIVNGRGVVRKIEIEQSLSSNQNLKR